MKHRVFQAIGLVAILVLALSLTGAAFAAPPASGGSGAIWTTNGDCGDDTQDVNHFDVGDDVFINGAGFEPGDYDWSIEGQPGGASGDPGETVASGTVTVGEDGAFCFNAYTVAGDDWGEYSVNVGNKGDNYRVEEQYELCSETTGPVYGEWSAWSDWYWNGEMFQRDRTRTVTYYDSQDTEHVCLSDVQTESEYDEACPWNPDIRAGDPACQPPPGEALATLVAFCGGGVNVNLANATIFIQFADQDPIEVTESGQVSLDLGTYSAWAEADEGFEFPEGTITQWEFSIDRCPRGHEEPPTGPDSIPLSAALPIAGSVTLGLGLLASAFRRKRQ